VWIRAMIRRRNGSHSHRSGPDCFFSHDFSQFMIGLIASVCEMIDGDSKAINTAQCLNEETEETAGDLRVLTF
jgi:hypothetical protein